ncbi:Ig-like domain-containing protein, partial [Alteraurantiacibacter aestuarii]
MSEELNQQDGDFSTDAAQSGFGESPSAQNVVQSSRTVPVGPSNTVTLPADAVIDQVEAVGRDLVITLADGSRIVIPEGAIILPQLVVGDTPIPPANLAALLVGNEPEPAAGEVQSSGGNFATDPGDIQSAFDIGDLLPYTELPVRTILEEEIIPFEPDDEPVITIEPDDSGVSVINAEDVVSEAGLPARNGEPEGTDSASDSEATFGWINFSSPDGTAAITINGVAVTAVGQIFSTDLGTLTITSISNGRIGYDYVLADNTTDVVSADFFTVTIIDTDGDQATATLRIDIIDDAPIAANDTDLIPPADFSAHDGNVITGVGTTSGALGVDIEGADGASVSGFYAGTSGSFADAGEEITGQFGTLILNADGSYVYTRNFNTPGGVEDVFTYQLTDGDGSADTATLTILISDSLDQVIVPEIGEATEVREAHLPPSTDTRINESPGTAFDGNSEAVSGTITFISPDGVGSVSVGGTTIDPGNLPQIVIADTTGTLIITDYQYDPATGQGSITYTYTLNDNTSDTDGTTIPVEVIVTDLDGDVASDILEIHVIDDAPIAQDDTAAQDHENDPVVVDVFANDEAGADGVDLVNDVAVVGGTLT